MFAFNPDVGPARLMRYVEPGTLPGENLLAVYDKSINLLIIDREKFETLTKVERSLLLRTHAPVTYWHGDPVVFSQAAE
jgi:hypothetical protein